MAAPLPGQDLEHILAHTQGLWDDFRDRPVFLTGGTGFIGTWLLESLLWVTDKLDVRPSVVVLTRDPEGFRARSPHLAEHRAVRLHKGDVVDFSFPEGRFPWVIHAATERAFEPDASRPLGAFDSDVAGTRRVLEFARQCGTRRMLFTSSGAVYGVQPAGITHLQDDYAGAPSTTSVGFGYGHAKRVSEYMCASYGQVYGFDVLIARLFAFVGPLLPLNENYAAGNFIRDALAGGPVRIEGDGTPYRSYLYSADLAIWLWTILLRGRSTQTYNVGSANALTIAELARTVVHASTVKMDVEIARAPVSGAPPLRYVPDTGRAANELGLRPLIHVAEGIRRTLAWHRGERAW